MQTLLGRECPHRLGSDLMDLLNTLVDKGLRRELPTRDEALAVLATSDD
ncbi:biotin synthase BioB, partial [Streptomyces sp. NPDC058251]